MFSDKDDNNADNDAALSLLLDDAVTNVPSSHRSSNYIQDASDSIFIPNEFAGKTPKRLALLPGASISVSDITHDLPFQCKCDAVWLACGSADHGRGHHGFGTKTRRT